MKKCCLFFLCFFLAGMCRHGALLAQKEANNWYFGSNAGLSFAGGSPVALTNGQLVTMEGCATISDPAGNLLFYTDGTSVWNRNHLVMPNGTALQGNSSSSQSAVVQLKPGSSSLYYIFTTDAVFDQDYGLRYSVVDMAAAAGNGDVTTKNALLNPLVTEKVTVVKHANGVDFWVVSHETNNNKFVAYLVSSAGVSTTAVVSSVGVANSNSVGYMKGSHSGKKIALANSNYLGGKVELLDFDNSTGAVSNPYGLNVPYAYGLEFSGADKYLYMVGSENSIYQLDVSTQQLTPITPMVSGFILYSMQLAPDGKIYVARYDSTFLSAISSPDLAGAACGYVYNAVDLAGRKCLVGLPSFAQGLLGTDSVSFDHTCLKDLTQFSTGAFANVTSFSWDFGDIFSGLANTATGPAPVHTFSSAGNYRVRLIITYANGTSDTVYRKVVIKPLPSILLSPSAALVCPRDTARVTAKGIKNFAWRMSGSPTVIDSDSLLVVNPSLTSIYTVSGSDSSGCVNSAQVKVTVRPLPDVQIFALSDSICLGKTVVMNAAGAVSYEWALQSAPSVIISRSSNYVDKPSSTIIYLLGGRDQYGCKNSTSKKIYVRGLPTLVTGSNPAVVCPGSQSVLKVKGARSYLWTVNNTPVSADSIFLVTPSVSTTYLVKGTDRFGCEGFDSSSVSVKKKPPVRSILGSPYVCPGLSGVQYKVTDSLPGSPVSSSTFDWTLSNATPSSGQLLTTDSLRADFSNTPGTATLSVVETNAQGCQGDPITFSVQIKSIFNPPHPKGQDSICTRDTVGQVYRTPYNTPGSIYKWHILGGSIKSGNTTHQVTVNWNTSGLRSGRIWFEELSNTAVANCYGLSDTLYVSIFPTPVTGPVTGKLSVCIGEKGLPYSVGVNNSSTFRWTALGGIIRSGNGSNVITVDWDSIPGVHTLKVLQRGNQGKCPGDTVYAVVIVNPTPVVASIEGPGIVCPSRTTALPYYIKNSHATSTYLWKVTGGSLTGGAGKDTIRVNWNADFTGSSQVYSLEVTELTQAGCVSVIKVRRIALDGSYPSLDAVSTALYNDRELEISWPQSYTQGQLSRYSLYRKTLADTVWSLMGASLLKNGYTDKQVQTHRLVYQYRYTVRDACGDSSTSRPQNSILLGATVGSSGNTILLSWNRYPNWSQGLQKYEVWRKLDEAGDYSFYQHADTLTSFRVNSTVEGFRHCYRIRAVENGGKNVSWSSDTCLVFSHPVEIPTAFSPNGDGVNDTWVIKSIASYPGATVEVFNRWGARVFFSENYTGWNGTDNGQDLPDGTYFYVIRLNKVVDNNKEALSGNVTIIR